MIKSLIGAGLVGAALLVGAPAALAAEPVDCAPALVAYGDAAKAAAAAKSDDQAAADAQKLYDRLAAAEAELAAAVKADNDAVPPLAGDSQRTKDAKAAVGKAKIDVGVFEGKGVTIEQLRAAAAKTDADELARAAERARVAASTACKGQDAAPTTPAPAAPRVVVVPDTSNGVDTGSW